MGVGRSEDLSSWPTKRQVAAVLGCSEKSVERFVQRGKLEQRSRPVPGSRPVAVYSPSDVAELRKALGVAVLPAQGSLLPSDPAQRSPLLMPAAGSRFDALAAELRSAIAARTPAVYVSLADAVDLVGLSAATILKLAADGKVGTMPYGRGVRFRRRDLENL